MGHVKIVPRPAPLFPVPAESRLRVDDVPGWSSLIPTGYQKFFMNRSPFVFSRIPPSPVCFGHELPRVLTAVPRFGGPFPYRFSSGTCPVPYSKPVTGPA